MSLVRLGALGLGSQNRILRYGFSKVFKWLLVSGFKAKKIFTFYLLRGAEVGCERSEV